MGAAASGIMHQLVTGSIRQLIALACQVEADDLAAIPQSGPLIIVANHVNSLEVPVMYTFLQPRPIAGFAKAETWRNPLLGYLFDLWGGIPLERGAADIQAIRLGLQALSQGKILAIAPEGTRNRTGVLMRAHPGIALIALRSRAPIVPIAYFGHENFIYNLKKLKRTRFVVKVGRSFTINTPETNSPKDVRQHIADEIMYQIAALLPPDYRGPYADLDAFTPRYLNFSQ